MASAFTKLFMPGHRRRASLSVKRAQSEPVQLESLSVKGPFASMSPSFNASIPEEPFRSPDRTRHSTVLTTDSLNAPPSAMCNFVPHHGPTSEQASTLRASRSPNSRLDSYRQLMSIQDPSTFSQSCDNLAETALPPDSQQLPRDDDDDLDDNPIFLRLSEEKQLAADWDVARLVLVPLRRCMPFNTLEELGCIEDDAFIALHAFAPSRLFKDQYVSIRSLSKGPGSPDPSAPTTPADSSQDRDSGKGTGAQGPAGKGLWDDLTLTASLDQDQRSVSVTVSIPGSSTSITNVTRSQPRRLEFKLQVVAETTVYRTVQVPPSAFPHAKASTRPSASTGFEVISRPPATTPSKPEKIKVRVMSVEDMVVPMDWVLHPSNVVTDSHSEALAVSSALTDVSPSGSVAFPSVEEDDRHTSFNPDETHSSSRPFLDVNDVSYASRRVSSIRLSRGDSSRSSHRPLTGLSEMILSNVPPERSFAEDLRLMVSPPPALGSIAFALTSSFETLSSAALAFTSTFVFVKGFDGYNVNRIRRGIWFKAWKELEVRLTGSSSSSKDVLSGELSADAALRLKQLLENVVMGFVHTKMYSSIAEQYLDNDESMGDALALYGTSGVGLVELGVHVPTLRHRPGRLEGAILTLRTGLSVQHPDDLEAKLASRDRLELLGLTRSSEEDIDDGSSNESEHSDLASAMAVGLGLSPRQAGKTQEPRSGPIRIRTPLETMQTLKATIDEIGMAVQRSNLGSSRTSLTLIEQPTLLSTDDLLPVLAYVLIKARPVKMLSCLYYARTFHLAEAPAADLSWALVNFEAVLEYLRTDPLQIRRSRSLDIGMHPSMPSAETSLRSLSSRSALATGSVALGSQYHSVSMSRRNSDFRERRVSMPAASLDDTYSPTSPMSPCSSSGAPFPTSSTSYFPRQDETTNLAPDDSSPLAKQDGFKLPALPASMSRRVSRTGQGIGSAHTSVGDGDSGFSHDGIAESHADALQNQSLSRQSSSRSRTISLTSGSADLQIRSQIVRTNRRPNTGSLSRVDLLGSTSMERASSSGSNHRVRLVGSPNLADEPSPTSPPTPKAVRRKSLDSWTALSIFGGSGGGRSSSEGNRAESVSGMERPMRSLRHRPLSQADSISSTENYTLANASSSTSWLPRSSEAGQKLPGTPGAGSIASADDVISPSSTFSSLPRSGSGSGFAAMPSTHSEGSPPTHAFPSSTNMSRRPQSIRSNSSYSSGQGHDDSSFTSYGQQLTAHNSANLTLPARRKHRTRFLSNAGSASGVSAPLPPKVDRESTAGDIPSRGSHLSLGSLSAVMATSLSQGSGHNPSSSMPSSPKLGDRPGSSSGEPNTPTQPQNPSWPGNGYATSDSFLPSLFRLHVPSPVTEIADPLSTPVNDDEDMSKAMSNFEPGQGNGSDAYTFASRPDLSKLPIYSTFKRRTQKQVTP